MAKENINNKNKSRSRKSPSTQERVILKTQINDKLTKVNLLSSVLGFIFLAVNSSILFIASKKHTNNVYFQVDAENRIVEIIPVDQPNQSIPSVSSWVKSALEETFSFNFVDYKERLSENTALYFTESGGQQLLRALERSRSLENIETKEMWLNLTLSNPVFIKRGVRNGIYTWHFQVRGQLNKYNVADEGTPETVVFDIYVERMDETVRERGLGISRLVMDRI